MKIGSGPGTDDKKLYKEVEQAMKSVGFDDAENKSIWRLMAAILHLGNIQFAEDGDTAVITNEPVLMRFAKLLDVNVQSAKDALVTRTVSAGGDIISAQHTAEIADYGRVCKK